MSFCEKNLKRVYVFEKKSQKGSYFLSQSGQNCLIYKNPEKNNTHFKIFLMRNVLVSQIVAGRVSECRVSTVSLPPPPQRPTPLPHRDRFYFLIFCKAYEVVQKTANLSNVVANTFHFDFERLLFFLNYCKSTRKIQCKVVIFVTLFGAPTKIPFAYVTIRSSVKR